MTEQSQEQKPASELLAALRNEDVRWNGNYFGLLPKLAGSAAELASRPEKEIIPALIDALSDPEMFVAAHVLLTFLSGVEHSTNPWNGLEVDLRPDGAVHIDPEQRRQIQTRWRRWYEASPRPRELPPALSPL